MSLDEAGHSSKRDGQTDRWTDNRGVIPVSQVAEQKKS